MLGVAGLAAHLQKAMIQPTTFQKIFKYPLHISRQFLSLLCHKRCERRVILIDDLIEKGLLGTMALVTTSIPLPAGHPGRRNMGHDPRPCDTVALYSLLLNCGILKPQL
jgi:hypothetical protein